MCCSLQHNHQIISFLIHGIYFLCLFVSLLLAILWTLLFSYSSPALRLARTYRTCRTGCGCFSSFYLFLSLINYEFSTFLSFFIFLLFLSFFSFFSFLSLFSFLSSFLYFWSPFSFSLFVSSFLSFSLS